MKFAGRWRKQILARVPHLVACRGDRWYRRPRIPHSQSAALLPLRVGYFTFGGTVLATMNLIRQLGGEVIGLAFLIELDYLHGRETLVNPPPIVR